VGARGGKLPRATRPELSWNFRAADPKKGAEWFHLGPPSDHPDPCCPERCLSSAHIVAEPVPTKPNARRRWFLADMVQAQLFRDLQGREPRYNFIEMTPHDAAFALIRSGLELPVELADIVTDASAAVLPATPLHSATPEQYAGSSGREAACEPVAPTGNRNWHEVSGEGDAQKLELAGNVKAASNPPSPATPSSAAVPLSDGRRARQPSESATRTSGNDANSPPTIGIITALPHESAAIRAALGDPPRIDVLGAGAGRIYWIAEVPSQRGGIHRVVIAQAGVGTNVAAVRANSLLSHFSRVRSIIMCGIAGGIPNPMKPDDHVRLGDIVVSNLKGVVQYDFVKRTIKKKKTQVPEEVRAAPHRPSAELLEAVETLAADEHLGERPWDLRLDQGLGRMRWARPEPATDVLEGTSGPVPHPGDPKRREGQPRVFLGPIASANTLLKDWVLRDSLRDRFGVKAVEMEGAGIADATWTHGIGYLVVRGVCDYADAKKNDTWHNYAAMAASAYVRVLLESMPGAGPNSGNSPNTFETACGEIQSSGAAPDRDCAANFGEVSLAPTSQIDRQYKDDVIEGIRWTWAWKNDSCLPPLDQIDQLESWCCACGKRIEPINEATNTRESFGGRELFGGGAKFGERQISIPRDACKFQCDDGCTDLSFPRQLTDQLKRVRRHIERKARDTIN
jgi:nucleoside phosphorylase